MSRPKGGGGAVRYRVGILTFAKTNYQNPHPRAKRNNCQNYQKQMAGQPAFFRYNENFTLERVFIGITAGNT